jgi:hypothetical protein
MQRHGQGQSLREVVKRCVLIQVANKLLFETYVQSAGDAEPDRYRPTRVKQYCSSSTLYCMRRPVLQQQYILHVPVDILGPAAPASAAMILPWCHVGLAWKPCSTLAVNSACGSKQQQQQTAAAAVAAAVVAVAAAAAAAAARCCSYPSCTHAACALCSPRPLTHPARVLRSLRCHSPSRLSGPPLSKLHHTTPNMK